MKRLLLLLCVISLQKTMAQNVGIGTSGPTEKLEVAGHIKANSFKFTIPKTLYVVVPGVAFQKQSDADNIERYSSNVFFNNPTANSMFAPALIPQGATITAFTVYFFDVSATANVTVSLNFFNYLGFTQSIALVTSSGDMGFGNVTDNTISPPTLVNYLTGTYTVEAFASNGAWPGPDLGISAIVITYTMGETN